MILTENYVAMLLDYILIYNVRTDISQSPLKALFSLAGLGRRNKHYNIFNQISSLMRKCCRDDYCFFYKMLTQRDF